MLNVLADAHIPYLDDLLPLDISLQHYFDHYPEPEQLKNADALLTRTTLRVDERLVSKAPNLKFVGSATAGFDHIDLNILKNEGIRFAYSPGCNAGSVAEYVLTAILLWADDHDFSLENLSLGIVGCGHAGSEVKQLAETFGLRTVCHDPPKAEQDETFTSASIEEVLTCDILSFHCALDQYPEHPSWHWLNEARLKTCTSKLIINAARGGITDEKALLAWREKTGAQLVTDVWENEPEFSLKTLEASFAATPHIAGYSVEAKWKASTIVCNKMARFFDFTMNETMPTDPPEYRINQNINSLFELLTLLHPIAEYDHRLRQLSGTSTLERKQGFAKIRSGFPLRQEFWHSSISGHLLDTHPVLKHFGFSTL